MWDKIEMGKITWPRVIIAIVKEINDIERYLSRSKTLCDLATLQVLRLTYLQKLTPLTLTVAAKTGFCAGRSFAEAKLFTNPIAWQVNSNDLWSSNSVWDINYV